MPDETNQVKEISSMKLFFVRYGSFSVHVIAANKDAAAIFAVDLFVDTGLPLNADVVVVTLVKDYN